MLIYPIVKDRYDANYIWIISVLSVRSESEHGEKKKE